MIGVLIYFAVISNLAITAFNVVIVQGKTWDNVSVRCGFHLAKAAMLVCGNNGPLVYFCMLLQIYNFALIVNKRRDSKPGQTLHLQVLFAFFTMHQAFLRTNHRERFESIPIGQVCPGGVHCSELVHNVLLCFEMLAPYFVGHLLLPLIVKARVMHAYAHQTELFKEIEMPE